MKLWVTAVPTQDEIDTFFLKEGKAEGGEPLPLLNVIKWAFSMMYLRDTEVSLKISNAPARVGGEP